MRFLALLLAGAALVCADSMSEPPTLGYVAAGPQLRKLSGVAGAARQITIDTVPLGTVVHPARGTVLSREGERLVLSERGDAAVLWGNTLLRVLGLTGEIVVRELELRAEVRSIAVSNGAERLATATPDGVRISGSTDRDYPDITSASALAFAGADLLVADADRALVWRIGENREVIATDISDVAALAADGSRLAIAHGNGIISVRDIDAATEAAVDCHCKPVQMARLARAGLWLLTSDPAQPLWVLDLSESEPRAWFIPAVALPEELR